MNKSLSISSCHHAQAIRKFFKKSRILKTERPAPYTDKNPQHDDNERHP